MKHIYILFVAILVLGSCSNSVNDEQAIKKVLANQATAWNKGNIDDYMKGYWNNDSLMFIGKNGPTYGYKATLERYKKSYPDAAAMGKLAFTILQVKRLSAEYYYVTGKWALERITDDLAGHFTLLFRNIEGQWVIIADHSS